MPLFFWFDLFLEAWAEILEKISLVFWEIWRHRKEFLKLADLYQMFIRNCPWSGEFIPKSVLLQSHKNFGPILQKLLKNGNPKRSSFFRPSSCYLRLHEVNAWWSRSAKITISCKNCLESRKKERDFYGFDKLPYTRRSPIVVCPSWVPLVCTK